MRIFENGIQVDSMTTVKKLRETNDRTQIEEIVRIKKRQLENGQ